MEDTRKRKMLLIIGIVVLLISVIGASYAYFTVSTTNNFGTHTISGTMEDVGSVALTSTGNNISLNLSAADMMQGNDDIYYFGSTDGTPNTSFNPIRLADATVTGSGYYDCDYTMQITATGTNNMYTAFQAMPGKSTEQIVFFIGDPDYLNGFSENGIEYDFNTSSLFPITYNGHISYVSNEYPISIYGVFYATNKSDVNQTVLAGTDITLNLTVTNLTCTAVTPYLKSYTLASETKYWNTNYSSNRYDNNVTLVDNNYVYYIKERTIPIEQTIANKHFYSWAPDISETYPTLDACYYGKPESDICIKYNNVYTYTSNNSSVLFDSLTECNNFVSSINEGSCVEYNKDDIYGEIYTSGIHSYEVCGVFGSTEVCLKPNDEDNAASYKSQMEAAGATCTTTDPNLLSNNSNYYRITNLISNNDYSITNLVERPEFLTCSAPSGQLICAMLSGGEVKCYDSDGFCGINPGGESCSFNH